MGLYLSPLDKWTLEFRSTDGKPVLNDLQGVVIEAWDDVDGDRGVANLITALTLLREAQEAFERREYGA